MTLQLGNLEINLPSCKSFRNNNYMCSALARSHETRFQFAFTCSHMDLKSVHIRLDRSQFISKCSHSDRFCLRSSSDPSISLELVGTVLKLDTTTWIVVCCIGCVANTRNTSKKCYKFGIMPRCS